MYVGRGRGRGLLNSCTRVVDNATTGTADCVYGKLRVEWRHGPLSSRPLPDPAACMTLVATTTYRAAYTDRLCCLQRITV